MKCSLPITVLLVDDSPMVRALLGRGLADQADIRVVGGAKDAFEARDLIIQHRPDVIILDIEMPRMDGLTFLRKLMLHYPVPVIMCSGVASAHSQTALKAIEIGAFDVISKPVGGPAALRRFNEELADKIRAAALSRPRPAPVPISATPASFRAAGLDPNRWLVAIGASTGGTEAIRRLLMQVPEDFPPVVIVQHMPAGFTLSFAARLNQSSKLSVQEAVGGEVLTSGTALLARGDTQMHVQRRDGRWHTVYGNRELFNRHCPSVDVLFNSAAESAGRQAVGVLLTGMGSDGAEGLLHMREAGAITIAQDQASSVVYGMPKVAVEIGAAQYQCEPAQVPGLVLKQLLCADRQRMGRIPVSG